jgi:hypothetical protein
MKLTFHLYVIPKSGILEASGLLRHVFVALTEGQAFALQKTTGNSRLVVVQACVSVILGSRVNSSLVMVAYILRD